MEALFKDEIPNNEIETEDSGPRILKEQVEKSIKNRKVGKTVESDGIQAKLLKLLDDKAIIKITKYLLKCVNFSS